jgi:hypothetical protein
MMMERSSTPPSFQCLTRYHLVGIAPAPNDDEKKKKKKISLFKSEEMQQEHESCHCCTAPFLLHSNHDQEHFCFWVEFAVVL